MASEKKVELYFELATALVKTASALLTQNGRHRGTRAPFQRRRPGAPRVVPPMPDRRYRPQLFPSSRPCEWPRTSPPTLLSGRPRGKSWHNANVEEGEASTVATAGVTVVVQKEKVRRVSVVGQGDAEE